MKFPQKFTSMFLSIAISASLIGCAATTQESTASQETASNQETTKTAFNVGVYKAIAKGFGGDIELEVTVSNNEITAINVVMCYNLLVTRCRK